MKYILTPIYLLFASIIYYVLGSYVFMTTLIIKLLWNFKVDIEPLVEECYHITKDNWVFQDYTNFGPSGHRKYPSCFHYSFEYLRRLYNGSL